jgi:hypothetical protein
LASFRNSGQQAHVKNSAASRDVCVSAISPFVPSSVSCHAELGTTTTTSWPCSAAVKHDAAETKGLLGFVS